MTPAPVEPAPVEPAPVEPPPQPVAPPPSTTPAPAPVAAPAPEIVATDPKPAERKASPAFQRPGIWLGTGAAFFAVGTVLRFIFPTVTKREFECPSGAGVETCETHEMTNAGIGILILSVPVDAMTLVSFGFAGRGYGFRGKDGRAKPASIGVGAAFLVAGAALEIASFAVPFKNEELNEFSYGIAAMREAALVAGSAGAFLVGYGVALPPPRHSASTARRRLALAPSFGRTHVGLSLTIR